MATLRGLGTYDKKLRADLEELSTNIWMGLPADGNKSGNLRGVYIVVTLPSPANTSFAVGHELGEVPLGYRMIGTPTSSIVELHPGTNADDAGGRRTDHSVSEGQDRKSTRLNSSH